MPLSIGYESASGLVEPNVERPKPRNFPGKTGVSPRDGAWDVASRFAIARDCRCKAFQKMVLRQGGHCALGNRAPGETYVDFVWGKIFARSCRAGLDTVVGLDLRK